ncbi:efflux RND transporter periplasmic adaptor subunit [Thiocystis violascens]|uniref:RND family efflux transporter, MFP subunit n=1 Tax=Thiocystis violascens (strain ATCC 17096 / DSM 198 / 6111) TaxID=765911 RepID=I3Y8T6_THIV6|nr:efflux RND transporter periplasmic adaptor subunit [Thiocystis violascens]AFL73404.1 RND family efflux transporter, MFP subunit [Thiocystis violascens DSM 198]
MEALISSSRGDSLRPASRAGASSTLAFALLALLTACQPTDESQPIPEPIRPVRVVTAEELPGGETVTLTGNVQAQDDVALAFRVGGQLIERTVSVGDRVRAGQIVARLDAVNERNAIDAARANLAAAMARLVEARNTVQRYEPLLPRGFVARAQFDRAVESRDAAQAQVSAAEAQVSTAENQLGFTTLIADGPGIVTARGAEPGEVVAAGRMIVRLAREGGRDAVFDVPARVIEAASAEDEVSVALSTDPKVSTTGRVREVSPQADPVTRTFKVRVGLASPPEAMRLGSTVTGSIQLGGVAGISLPTSALTASQGAPAVWTLDPESRTVALRNVDVASYELDRVLISQGLEPGELVVTAGVQTLRPGQQVRLLGEPTPDLTGVRP